MIIEIEISTKTYNSFILALSISGESQDAVIEDILNQYSIRILQQLQKKNTPTEQQAVVLEAINPKALSRFPGWARKSGQMNHQVISAFYLSEINGAAERDDMYNIFKRNNPTKARHFFDGNLNSLATEKGNSHGKCFILGHDSVRLMPNLADMAEQYRSFFIEQN